MKDSSRLARMVSIIDMVVSLALVSIYSCFILTSTNAAAEYFSYSSPIFIFTILLKLWADYKLYHRAKPENTADNVFASLKHVKTWLVISIMFCVAEMIISLVMQDLQFWIAMSGFVAIHMISIVVVMPFVFALQAKICRDAKERSKDAAGTGLGQMALLVAERNDRKVQPVNGVAISDWDLL